MEEDNLSTLITEELSISDNVELSKAYMLESIKKTHYDNSSNIINNSIYL